ncbi:unnamed protein product [Calypogeia fissa]
MSRLTCFTVRVLKQRTASILLLNSVVSSSVRVSGMSSISSTEVSYVKCQVTSFRNEIPDINVSRPVHKKDPCTGIRLYRGDTPAQQ